MKMDEKGAMEGKIIMVMAFGFILAVLLIGLGVIGLSFDGGGGINIGGGSGNITTLQAGMPFSKLTMQFKTDHGSEQDDVDDENYDIFTCSAEALQELADDGIIDCTRTTPYVWSGGNTLMSVDGHVKNQFEEFAGQQISLCKVNLDWAAQTATIGNHETRIDDECTALATDVGASAADDTNTTTVELDNDLQDDEYYLVLLTDDSEIDDLIPTAFLVTLPEKTEMNIESIEDGDTKVTVKINNVRADAVANTRTDISGECRDDDDNSNSLDSALDYASHSSHTTATANEDLDCDINVGITGDEYCLVLRNPLPASTTEKGYCVIEPYGTNASNSTNGVWQKVTGNSVDYISANPSAAGSHIIYAESTFEGVAITSNSGSDALKEANENIYESNIGAFTVNVICGDDGDLGVDDEISFDYRLTDIAGGFDYNAATNGSDIILQSNSHSTPESIADISCYSPMSATDYVGQDLDI